MLIYFTFLKDKILEMEKRSVAARVREGSGAGK